MGFSIDRRAHKPKGLFRKAPDPQEIGDRLTRLVKRIEKKNVVRLARKQGQMLAEIEMHPGASPVRLMLDAEAVLSVRGDTGAIGPGYHADVIARVERILEEIDYKWADTEEADVPGRMCAWLAGVLAGDGQIKIGIPPERVFLCDASVMTAAGPRDEAWRARVIANPREGADAFPWWKRGAGQAARARALHAMWFDIPWRAPIYPDESELLERVDGELREARAADPAIDLPYPEWALLMDFLELDTKHANEIRQRAGDREATIGYRRLDMDVELSGWSMHLPGSFTGLWLDDGARYWASDGDRIVELTTFTADGETDSDRLLAIAEPQHAIIEQLVDGARRGRIEAHDEADVHMVTGLIASAPHVAILTFKVTPKDQAWALATWRSLRHE